MLTKHQVTYFHRVSNPRDTAGQVPAVTLWLDLGRILVGLKQTTVEQRARLLGAALRRQGVLVPNARVREYRVEWEDGGGRLVIFPTLPGTAYHHAVVLDLHETYNTVARARVQVTA